MAQVLALRSTLAVHNSRVRSTISFEVFAPVTYSITFRAAMMLELLYSRSQLLPPAFGEEAQLSLSSGLVLKNG